MHLAARGTVEAVDPQFMSRALALARAADRAGEIPIGAVVVRDGQIVGEAYNSPLACTDPTAHAEILALRRAAVAAGNYRLVGTTMYVTAEPCLMCVGALIHARVARVVYGCREPKAGALGSAADVREVYNGNHRFAVVGGVCADEAAHLLREFFRQRRGA